MNIRTTQLKQPAFRPQTSHQNTESSTLGLNYDPFGGVKKFIGDTVELGASFTLGALPGYGVKHHGEMAIIGGWNGRSNAETRTAFGGAALNAAGTVSLAVGAGQYFLGGDPTIALGVSAAALAGSGVISTALMH